MDDIEHIDAIASVHSADPLLGIGAFARRVGLAPSALRFYDDCGMLRPAHVDDTTGYRYYAPDQEGRAALIRRLREAGMPLTDTSVVLDGTRDEARAVLEGHARRARETAASAQAAIEDVLRDLADGVHRTCAWVGGAELAAAVRQVAPAAATAETRAEFAVLGCVLIELDREEVRLVATDRYRLAVRALRPSRVDGGPHRLLVDADGLRDIASWAVRLTDVGIEVDRQGARLHGDGVTREIATADGTFPDYRLILDDLPPARHRVIADRTALRAAVTTGGCDGPLILRTDEERLTVTTPGPAPTAPGVPSATTPVTSTPPAVCTGPPVRIAFDPAVLLPALDAGVGPDVLLEISSPTGPVVVRSADQGGFTTLVMPVRDDAPAGG